MTADTLPPHRRDLHIRLSPVAATMLHTACERLGLSPSSVVELLVRSTVDLILNLSDMGLINTAPPPPAARSRRTDRPKP